MVSSPYRLPHGPVWLRCKSKLGKAGLHCRWIGAYDWVPRDSRALEMSVQMDEASYQYSQSNLRRQTEV